MVLCIATCVHMHGFASMQAAVGQSAICMYSAYDPYLIGTLRVLVYVLPT